jgi:hypothetical protein
MIKVEHTKTLELNRQEDGWHWSGNLVTDAELVLVYNPDKFDSSWNYKPILISRTEKIEVGDWVYHPKTKSILQVGKEGWLDAVQSGDNTYYKILALPEHFSHKHLQAIVDGKLKDGDKVLVECESFCAHGNNCPSKGAYDKQHLCDVQYKIKLNPLTIYPVEETCPTCGKDGKFCSDSFHKGEKMYSSEQVHRHLIWCVAEIAVEIAAEFGLTPREGDMKRINDATNRWFEQNVK